MKNNFKIGERYYSAVITASFGMIFIVDFEVKEVWKNGNIVASSTFNLNPHFIKDTIKDIPTESSYILNPTQWVYQFASKTIEDVYTKIETQKSKNLKYDEKIIKQYNELSIWQKIKYFFREDDFYKAYIKALREYKLIKKYENK